MNNNPFAIVRCDWCGPVGLSEAEYLDQLKDSRKPWLCPKCGEEAWFDDAYYEERHQI